MYVNSHIMDIFENSIECTVMPIDRCEEIRRVQIKCQNSLD